MRVTEKTIFDTAARNSGVMRDRVQRAVEENSTGLRVKHPWDDPGVTAPIIGHRISIKRQEALATTAERTNDELLAADAALNNITETLSRARQLAIQLANDTYAATDRTVGAEEIRTLFRDAIGAMNTQVGNRYIFAGFQDDAAPFAQDGTYLGDSGIRQVEAFPGVMQTTSIPGDVLARGAGGGPDFITGINDLITALSTNNVAGVQGTLDILDQGIEHLSLARAQLGAGYNTLTVAADTARGVVNTEKATISRLAEADTFEAATKMALAQRALEAALTASVRSFDLTLLNKL